MDTDFNKQSSSEEAPDASLNIGIKSGENYFFKSYEYRYDFPLRSITTTK